MMWRVGNCAKISIRTMGHSKYDDDTKAAVMAALLQGQSVTRVAKDYDIPKGTVSGWKKKAEQAAGDSLEQIPTQKRGGEERIGELLLEYIQQNVQALRAQAEQFSDEQWLKKQSASEVATLHGVMTDKAVRLLEALSANHEPDA